MEATGRETYLGEAWKKRRNMIHGALQDLEEETERKRHNEKEDQNEETT